MKLNFNTFYILSPVKHTAGRVSSKEPESNDNNKKKETHTLTRTSIKWEKCKNKTGTSERETFDRTISKLTSFSFLFLSSQRYLI